MRALFSVAAVLVAAGAAQAATISFASDTNPNGPTFNGISGGPPILLRDGGLPDPDGLVTVALLVDADENGPGLPTVEEAGFFFDATLTGYSRTMVGTAWRHEWLASGTLMFHHHATGEMLLGVEFANALMTSWSESQFDMGLSATLQWNALVDPAPGPFDGTLTEQFGNTREFAFTLTNIRAFSELGPRVAVSSEGTFRDDWASEGSFSATLVPTPGAMGLLGLGGLLAARRRGR